MNRSAQWIVIMALAAWFTGRGFCDCAGATSFCERLPNPDDKNSAIFLGTVTQIQGTLVTLKVTESFLNAAVDEIQVVVTSDSYIDGVPRNVLPFAQGQDWLVEAVRESGNQPWTTSRCLRTKASQSAVDDLKVLRAWRSGQQLPARIFGEVWNPEKRANISGIRIDLVGGIKPLSATSDERGEFVFDGLSAGKYEAVALLPTGAVRRDVDLAHGWCGRAVFLVK
jgi:microcompartment protein CcmK/EutM